MRRCTRRSSRSATARADTCRKRIDDDETVARMADQRVSTSRAPVSDVLDHRGFIRDRAHRRAHTGPGEHLHPAGADPARAAGAAAHARLVLLRDQWAPLLVRRLVHPGLSRRRLLVGSLRGHPVQHHFLGTVRAAARPRKSRRRMTGSADRIFSFEFFPPATPEGVTKLRATREQLERLGPKFFSVTFGAGGSTRDRTLAAVLEIQAAGQRAAPHISCIGSTRESIRATLATYREHGIGHLVALRGDLPSGSADVGEFRYANELVEFIRETTGDAFHIDVACYPEYHPQAKSPAEDLASFKRKIDAGADSAITQYFFSPESYYHFVESAAALGVDVPIVPGIMPIASFSKLARFSDACGAEIPRWIRRKLESFGDDAASIRSFGLDVVTDLCANLLEHGAPGL